jgi:chaperonin cofactor prefoldin
MSQLEQQIESIELSMEQAKKLVVNAQTAERLSQNPDFKKLVMEGYFVEEAARLALLLTDPTTVTTPHRKEMVMNALIGVGGLKQHLSAVIQMGRQAENDLVEMGETIEELRQEDADGEVQ